MFCCIQNLSENFIRFNSQSLSHGHPSCSKRPQLQVICTTLINVTVLDVAESGSILSLTTLTD